MGQPLATGEFGLWIQPSGVGGVAEYLGCHEVAEVKEPLGDATPILYPDSHDPGGYIIDGALRGQAGSPTFSVKFDLQDESDWFERLRWPCNVLLVKSTCGRRDALMNYDFAIILERCVATQKGLSSLSAKAPGGGITSVEFSMVAARVHYVRPLETSRILPGAPFPLFDIDFQTDRFNRRVRTPPRHDAQFGVAVGDCDDSPVGKAMIYITEDGGDTWAPAAADPFAVSETIHAVRVIEVGRSTRRILVGRMTTDFANPPEVAYSDNDGASWTCVNIGAVNGAYIGACGLSVFDEFNVYAMLSNGSIFKSIDAGTTWTVSRAPAGSLFAIWMADRMFGYAGGAANLLVKTSNSGTDAWPTVTTVPAARAGDTIRAVCAPNRDTVWIGYLTGGYIYCSHDDGVTWEEHTLPIAAGANDAIMDIDFVNCNVGYVLYRIDATSKFMLLRTFNGGADWEIVYTADDNTSSGMCAVSDNEVYLATGYENAVPDGIVYRFLGK